LLLRSGVTPTELRKRLAEFAVQIAGLTDPLLDNVRARESALQLRRCAASAAAIHRAAGRARSHREFTSTIGEALEEADECGFWLEHLLACDLVRGPVAKSLLDEAAQLTAILTKSHATSQRRDQDLPPLPRRSHRRRRQPIG